MSQVEKRVGIFMKVYRNESSMHEAIKSVLGQTYTNIRYYILVNESTKDTVEKYAQTDERIELINGSSTDGFRTYVKYIASNNAYVTTIDADDWYAETYVEHLLQMAEANEADIVACGNYYFTGNNNVVGERKQKTIVWEVERTNQVLPFVYGHFRTIWGKLFKSEVLTMCDIENLPKFELYGGYGGDTLFVFNLFQYARKLCVSDKTLYYYRMSETSSTYKLIEGRLDSDEVLFSFVEKILKNLGKVEDRQRRFLLWIYGNALIDTIKLLLQTQLPEQDRAAKLLYVFEKPLTKELFLREATENIEIPELGINKNYAEEVKDVIFSCATRNVSESQETEKFMNMLEITYPGLKGNLKPEEFRILMKSKKILDAYVAGEKQQVFEMLIVIFHALNMEEEINCLSLLAKLTSNVILKSVLVDVDFVKKYADVIRLINNESYVNAIELVKNYFSQETLPNNPEALVVLWNNLAAGLENVPEYVLSKQLKVEVFVLLGKKEEAIKEYSELMEMNIKDDTMDYLSQILYAGV